VAHGLNLLLKLHGGGLLSEINEQEIGTIERMKPPMPD
jgi:hypothetical protein